MECPICICEFSENKRNPLLCNCGNSICEQCAQNIVTKNGNTFICPLCKYHKKNYKESGLPVNKSLLNLVIDLDILLNPQKEVSTLTDQLLLKDVETQHTGSEIPKKYSEYLAVIGTLIFAASLLPWTILGLVSSTSCEEEDRKLFGVNFVMFIVLSSLWICNSDNLIETDWKIKRFFCLFIAIVSGFCVFFKETWWVLGRLWDGKEKCEEFYFIAGESLFNFCLFSLLLIEGLDRYILALTGRTRNYYYSMSYKKSIIIEGFYIILCYGLQDYFTVLYLYENMQQVDPSEKLCIGIFFFSQLFLVWNTLIPLFNEIQFSHTLSLQLIVISSVNILMFNLLLLNSFVLGHGDYFPEFFFTYLGINITSFIVITIGTVII